jgi:hypothetical protein
VRERHTKAHIELRSLPRKVRRQLEAIAEDVADQNGLLARTALDIKHPSCPSPFPGFFSVGSFVTDTLKTGLSRIFVRDDTLGGRWYGGFWQNLPSRTRAGLVINQERTVEVDFSACQMRLAHGVLGLPDPLGGKVRPGREDVDLYAVAGVERTVVKRAVLIMINATNRDQAERALAQKIQVEGLAAEGISARYEARRALEGVVEHFSRLKELWFTDLGLWLQRIDADVCAMIQRALRSRDIAVLSVHDSFIVGASHREALETEMEQAFQWGMDQAKTSNKRLVA